MPHPPVRQLVLELSTRSSRYSIEILDVMYLYWKPNTSVWRLRLYCEIDLGQKSAEFNTENKTEDTVSLQ